MRRNAYKAVGRCRIKSMKSKIPRNGNQCIGERLALDRRVYTYSIAGKGKAERYVRAQVHPILCDPLACNSPGSFARGIPCNHIEVGCHFLLQGVFPAQRSSPRLFRLLHWQVGSLPLCHLGSPGVYAGCWMFSDQKLICFPPDGFYFLSIVGLPVEKSREVVERT